MAEGRVRVQAARWVVPLGRVTTVLYAWAAIGSAVVAWAGWSPLPLLLTLLFAGLATGWHVLLAAFGRHRRGAWVALVLVSATGVVSCLAGWLSGGDVGVLGLVGGLLDAVLLWLLVHPDSREWVARPAPRRAAEPVP